MFLIIPGRNHTLGYGSGLIKEIGLHESVGGWVVGWLGGWVVGWLGGSLAADPVFRRAVQQTGTSSRTRQHRRLGTSHC